MALAANESGGDEIKDSDEATPVLKVDSKLLVGTID